MNLVLINYVMKILWPFLIRVSRNIRTFWTSTAVLALNKMSLWDFSSAFTDKYYQVHVLIPHPLMPTSPAGNWCWAGAVLCSDTEPSPRQTPTLVSTLPWASIPPALPLSGAVTPKLQSTRGLLPLVPWGLKGECGGFGRCFQVLKIICSGRGAPWCKAGTCDKCCKWGWIYL